MDPIIKKIRKQNKIIGFVVIAIFMMIAFGFSWVSKKVENGPEQEFARAYISNSDSLRSKYGQIEKIECQGYEMSKSLSGNSSSGMFEFRITGSKKQGLERLVWNRENDKEIKINSIQEVHISGVDEVMRDIKALFLRKK